VTATAPNRFVSNVVRKLDVSDRDEVLQVLGGSFPDD